MKNNHTYQDTFGMYKLREELRCEYYSSLSKLNLLTEKIDNNDYPAFVGRRHGTLLEAQRDALAAYVKILQNRMVDLGMK